MRLKSREQFPPGQFQALLPETGQQKPFVGSFMAVTLQTYDLIRGNPFLAKKNNWPTDIKGVEEMVEQQNVQRCIAGRWFQWLEMDAPDVPLSEPAQKKTRRGFLGNVVADGSRVKAGINTLTSWVGSGGQPVETGLAIRRADICSTCPKNGSGNYTSYFTKPVADEILLQLEMKTEMQLRTPYDGQLGVCEACLCPLKLKPWVPIEHVAKYLSEEVRAELDPKCWILSETKQAK